MAAVAANCPVQYRANAQGPHVVSFAPMGMVKSDQQRRE